ARASMSVRMLAMARARGVAWLCSAFVLAACGADDSRNVPNHPREAGVDTDACNADCADAHGDVGADAEHDAAVEAEAGPACRNGKVQDQDKRNDEKAD